MHRQGAKELEQENACFERKRRANRALAIESHTSHLRPSALHSCKRMLSLLIHCLYHSLPIVAKIENWPYTCREPFNRLGLLNMYRFATEFKINFQNSRKTIGKFRSPPSADRSDKLRLVQSLTETSDAHSVKAQDNQRLYRLGLHCVCAVLKEREAKRFE